MFQNTMTKNEIRITLKKTYLKPCLYFIEVNELVKSWIKATYNVA